MLLLGPGACVAGGTVTASEPECGEAFASIQGLTVLRSPADELTVKLFELGGGDPVMNGLRVVVNASPWDPARSSYTWDLGIDVYQVVGAYLDAGTLVLVCRQHYRDEAAAQIRTRDVTFVVTGLLDPSGSLQDRIEVERLER